MPDPTPQKLAIEVAEVRERMNAHQAETKAKVFEYQLENRTGWQTVLNKIADYRAEHQAAINTLSEKMVNRELRLIAALITVVALAVAFLRFTPTTPTIVLPTPTPTATTITTADPPQPAKLPPTQAAAHPTP